MSSEEVPSAEPGEFDLTDPKAMRALAHPLRMTLLELLREHQTLTATQASELMGESPANCAFHLRTLAKYGFVQEAGGGRGRERPWRSVIRRIRIRSGQPDPQAAVAARALGQMWRDRVFESARQAFAATLPLEWEGARQFNLSLTYLTADELRDLGQVVDEVLSRHEDREDPERRPEGALPVEMVFFGYPIINEVRDIS